MKVQTLRAPCLQCWDHVTSRLLLYVCAGFSLDYRDEGVDSLLALKDKLENPDHSVLYKTCSDLTRVHFTQQGTQNESARSILVPYAKAPFSPCRVLVSC